MFVRNKRSVGKGGAYEYLKIVRSYRKGGKVLQQIIGTLGRRDHLVASGELEGLLKSVAKFSEKLRVVEAVRETGLTARTTRQRGVICAPPWPTTSRAINSRCASAGMSWLIGFEKGWAGRVAMFVP
jgi:hypothetical protein